MKNSHKEILQATWFPIIVLVVIWGVHFLNLSFPELNFYQYGNLPRKPEGLIGIITSPFIHSTENFKHIFNNSVPLFVLLWLSFVTYKKLTYKVLLFIWLASGIWVWIAARDSYHIGASGIIYGLVFFLFFSGVFKRSMQLMGVSLLMVFLYGSMVWGLFPIDPTISFEGHLFGALAGFIMAYYMKEEGPVKDKYDLTVEPEFEQFVDEYNQELKELAKQEEYWQQTTTTSKDDEFKVFFEYLKRENSEDKKD